MAIDHDAGTATRRRTVPAPVAAPAADRRARVRAVRAAGPRARRLPAINPDFLSPLNISNTLAFTVELGLIALAMTLLMTAGEFDLSVGSVFGFSPVVMWTLFNSGTAPLEVGVPRRHACWPR